MPKYMLHSRRVLAGEDLKAVENAAVVVEDARIAFVGSRTEAEARYPGCAAVDLGGATLMPGMIDCHSHTSLDARVPGHLEMMNDPVPDLTIRGVNNVRDDLLSGVTTVRILGEKGYADVSIRNAIAAGALEGPRLLVAGIGMRSLHGHGYVGVAHTGPGEFRLTCRENLLRRVDWLKIFVTGGAPPAGGSRYIPTFVTPEELAVVTGEAKMAGVRSSAHCIGGPGLAACVAAGIDVIDHAYCATDADLELVARNGRWICLTPSVFMDRERNTKNPPGLARNIELGRDWVVDSMRKIVRSGVSYAIGSDALHGGLALEAKYAVELGAQAADALAGVTVKAARLCGIAEKTGSLTPGKFADIVAVEGDPRDDIGSLGKVVFVMKEGKTVGSGHGR